ncbi:MAG: GTPase HflX [Clostridia bacterium]
MTYNLMEEKQEKAFLVYFSTQDEKHELAEMKELIRSAMLEFVGSEYVTLREINPHSYIGVGKVEEIAFRIQELDVDVVIFDVSLTGSQLRNLQAELGVKVIDRTMLILDIFAGRAKSNEGKLQVELAQLKYTLPRLSGISGTAGRFGGGVGMRGPGETKLELDKRKIQENIQKKEKELKIVNEKRQLTRKQRKNREYMVSLVGYSNAGKSTLMNTITKADTYADNRLFATLDVLTKRVWDDGTSYVLCDTVGFISNLPHELMNAFSATLEEVRDADLCLIILDASDKSKYEQLRVVEDELTKQNVSKDNCILVYNKCDLLNKMELSVLEGFGYTTCKIQAKHNQGVAELKALIREKLNDKY